MGVGSQNNELPHLRQKPRLRSWRGAIPAQVCARVMILEVRWRASGGGADVGVHALAELAVANHHVPERAAHLEPHRAAKTAAGRARPGVISSLVILKAPLLAH